jgi:hypothetical protein
MNAFSASDYCGNGEVLDCFHGAWDERCVVSHPLAKNAKGWTTGAIRQGARHEEAIFRAECNS